MKILEFNQNKDRLIIEENGKKKKYTIWHAWQTNDEKHMFFECNPYFLNIFSASDNQGFAPLFVSITVKNYLEYGALLPHPFKYENKKTKLLVVSEDGTMLFGDEAVEFFDSLVIIEKMVRA